MTASDAARLSPLLKQSSDLTAVRGEGAWLYDSEGRRYLDFSSGIGVTSTGHCHPRVVEAARDQAGKLIHGQYAIMKHQPLLTLTERLGELLPAGLDRLFSANAGTEAVEAALRLARQATGRQNVIVFQGGFHGRTMGSLSMTTSSVGLRAGLQPMMGGVVVAPFPNVHHYGWDEATTTDFCLRELDNLLHTQTAPAETAAVLLEPVQGEAGYVPANSAFMRGLREICDAHGMLLILDEVQAGNGRTGRYWGHDHFGVAPDLLVTAKGLASGFPLSALAAPAAIMEQGWPGSQGGTYGGNAVACAAAVATLEVIRDEGLVENAAARGEQLHERLLEVQRQHPAISDVRGLGLMQGTVLVDGEGRPDGARAGRVLKEMEARGVVMIRCGAYGQQIVRWLPPLIVTAEQVDQAVDTFAEALAATA